MKLRRATRTAPLRGCDQQAITAPVQVHGTDLVPAAKAIQSSSGDQAGVLPAAIVRISDPSGRMTAMPAARSSRKQSIAHQATRPAASSRHRGRT